MTTEAETGAGDSARLVSISDAAKALTEAGDSVDRSALSRYCDAHDLKRGKRGRSVMVDLEEVARHRRENYTREVMRGEAGRDHPDGSGVGGSVVTATEGPAPVGPSPSVATPDPVAGSRRRVGHSGPAAGSTSADIVPIDPTRREKTARAEKAELDLIERKGLITPVDDVAAAIADGLATMRQVFGATAKLYAAEAMPDLGLDAEQVRALGVHFKRFARRGEEAFIDRMKELAGDLSSDQSDYRRRLEHLAEQAAIMTARDDANRQEIARR